MLLASAVISILSLPKEEVMPEWCHLFFVFPFVAFFLSFGDLRDGFYYLRCASQEYHPSGERFWGG